MSRRYFVSNIILTLFLIYIGGGLVTVMFLPLVGVIDNLTEPAQKAGAQGGLPGLAVYHPWALPTLAAVLAVLAVVLAWRGIRRDTGRRGWWIAMIVLNSICVLFSLSLMMVAPKFASLYQDLLK